MSRPLRVAVVAGCPFPVPQGSQVYLAHVAEGLARRGHEVHVVAYGYGLGEPPPSIHLQGSATLPGSRVAAGPSWAKPVNDFLLTKRLRRVIREHAIDVVDAHNYEGLLVALAAGHRPIVYHAHNAMADELPTYFRGSRAAGALGGSLDRTLPKRADAIVALHEAQATYLRECGCGAERLHVIPPAVDTNQFTPVQHRLENPPILYTGNLDSYQNLAFLERVVARVREKRPETPFHVATASEGAVAGATRIPVNDLAALREVLAGDAVTVCPRVSWSGFPIKLLNAMAAGQAILACASSAIPIVNGENGVVVRDNAEDAFVFELLTLLQYGDLREYYGTAARKTVQEHHHPEKAAAALERVLNEAAAPV